jgi:hypothetical protein
MLQPLTGVLKRILLKPYTKRAEQLWSWSFHYQALITSTSVKAVPLQA